MANSFALAQADPDSQWIEPNPFAGIRGRTLRERFRWMFAFILPRQQRLTSVEFHLIDMMYNRLIGELEQAGMNCYEHDFWTWGLDLMFKVWGNGTIEDSNFN